MFGRAKQCLKPANIVFSVQTLEKGAELPERPWQALC
jgi:hypothetical protein